MTNRSSAKYGLNTQNARNWSSKEWFTLLVVLLVICIGVYIVSHSERGVRGYEYTSFTSDDINSIDNILATSTLDKVDEYKPSQQRDVNINDGFLDSYPDLTEEPENEYTQTSRNVKLPTKADLLADRQKRIDKAIVYIKSQYEDEIDDEQFNTIKEYLNTFSRIDAKEYLSELRLKVRSYFWLTGPLVYLEVIFWVIIGVLCSMLYAVANIARKGMDANGYSSREIIYQIAKLFYAPFVAITLVLAYSYFKKSTTLHIDANEGVIVFAFLIGFYSGTFMEIMERLKFVVFNSGSGGATSQNYREDTSARAYTAAPPHVPDEEPIIPQTHSHQPQQEQAYSATEQVQTQAPQNPLQAIREQVAAAKERETAKQQEAQGSFDNLKPLPKKVQQQQNKSLLNDDNELKEVDIDLKLDLSGLFDEERAELQRLGFSKAIVTLHNVNGKDIIPAKKVNEDLTTFVAHDVKPGIYIARATLSQRLKDEQIINLFGEKTAYITADKPGLELYVKKYEAMD